MCQTSLPFKNMGDVRDWENRNGNSLISIEAGKVYNPETDKMVNLGLPYGTKPRLILLYLNAQAIKQQSAKITVEESFKAFIESIGLDATGRPYRAVKDQLARLSASHITIGRPELDGTGTTSYGRIVDEMNLFFPKDDNQRLLWPNSIKLSNDYYNSLANHAVPLDQHALRLLKDSSLELDLYAMLAERLHRIPGNKPQFVGWANLWEQYGNGYKRIDNFRTKFLKALVNVVGVYPAALVEETTTSNGRSKGLTFFHSKPPVRKVAYLTG